MYESGKYLVNSIRFNYRPVRHFARHGLCRNKEGKQNFYNAMKSKLCQINGKTFFMNVE